MSYVFVPPYLCPDKYYIFKYMLIVQIFWPAKRSIGRYNAFG